MLLKVSEAQMGSTAKVATTSCLGGAATTSCLGGAPHRDLMWGLEGDDVLRGYGGEDQLVEGVGSDELYGGADGDYLRADNPAPNILRGGDDDDWIFADDNSTAPDDIDCGKGKGDVAIRDPEDVVVNCENAGTLPSGAPIPYVSPDVGAAP
jgi:RTX calcium-binding nonapeptide repeat (4 copies)